jgi:hypothetical protein
VPPSISFASGAIIFMHEMVAPNGNHRLVVVDYYSETDSFTGSFIGGFNYIPSVIIRGTWSAGPRQIGRGWDIDVDSSWPRTPPLVQIYAGQLDPADASHFTAKYQMWGQEDVLDGRLGNNDDVTLTQRNRPQWK